MNQLAPQSETLSLRRERRRFIAALCGDRHVVDADDAGDVGDAADVLLSLDARAAPDIIAQLPAWACRVAPGGVLIVAERVNGSSDLAVRRAIAARFAFATCLQQRPLAGSVIFAERHASSRILPLAEPLPSFVACLLHIASDLELPLLATSFLQHDGAGTAPLLAPDFGSSTPASLPVAASDDQRRRAVGLVERLVSLDEKLFGQSRELARLRHQIAEAPRAEAGRFFDNPTISHSWPMAENRDCNKGFYDHRVDDPALLQGDAGVLFLSRHRLFDANPDHQGAVRELNAMPRPATLPRPEVSIVIPVHGQLAWTLNCLHSLFALPDRTAFEILVIDDASPDETGAVLARVRGLCLIGRVWNRGFIDSCNTGASQARGRHVLFLNNDTRVVPGWLDNLLASFEWFPKAGLIGSKMLYPDGTLQEAGGIIWRDGSCWNLGRDDDPNRPHYAHAREVDYVSGCSIILPSALFRSLGGFDMHFAPAYCEDADLAMRVRAAGHEVWFQPQSRIIHYEGRTAGTDTGTGVKAYQVSNGRKLYQRWRHSLAAHRPNAEAPFLERERGVKQRALIVDATVPTPRQDAGPVTTTLTLGLFRSLGYKPHFVPQENFLFQPEDSPELMRMGIEVAYAPYEQDFDEYMRRYGWSFDIVLVYRVTVLEKVIDAIRRHAPQAPVLFHNMDLHFLRMEREARLKQDSAALREAHAMRVRELGLIARADCTITHSTFERDLLATAVPGAKCVVWPFMFEHQGTQADFTSRRDFCFLGGYRHAPNVDAVLFFVHEILPLVHAFEPQARLIVAGAHPTPEILALAGRTSSSPARWTISARCSTAPASLPAACGSALEPKARSRRRCRTGSRSCPRLAARREWTCLRVRTFCWPRPPKRSPRPACAHTATRHFGRNSQRAGNPWCVRNIRWRWAEGCWRRRSRPRLPTTWGFQKAMRRPWWSIRKPLSSAESLSRTPTMRPAAVAASCTSSPALANGADNSVATVPGCTATQIEPGLWRRNSIEAVRMIWFSAALDAR